jgi:purine-binding chemotaxis protein CheW
MDIAKIRKKFRDTGQTCEGPSLNPVSLPVSVEDIEKKTDIPPSTLQDKAEEHEKENFPDTLLELLTFHLSLGEYAFRIEEIQEIIRPIKITRVPRSVNYLLGITSLRGKIIPVIDLGKRISLRRGSSERNRRQKILIVKGPKGPIGAMIDGVDGVIRSSLRSVVEAPLHIPESEKKFIEGIVTAGHRFISLLRTAEVMNITLKEAM